jgi:hypothetical protein
MKRIALLAFVIAAIGVGGCRKDPPAEKSEAPAAAPADAPSGSPQLLALLPANDEVAGWTVSRAARSYTADNLWELINGAADGFVTYGVQEVVAAEYTQAGTGDQAVIEAYQMKDALNAFGKYAEERHPSYQFIQVGSEGYSGGTSVNFWAGQYYVKITTFREKAAITKELIKLAQSSAAKVKEPAAEPRELGCFPKENQLPHTTLYVPKDVLARSYFANGFEAKYKSGPTEHKLVLVAMESDEAAREGLARYRESVAKGGKGVTRLAAPGDEGFAAKDSFYGNLAAVRSGRYVAIALGHPSDAVGRKQLAELVENLK